MREKIGRSFGLLLLIFLFMAVFNLGVCAGKTTISFWHAGNSESMITTMRSLIQQFEAKNKDIRINYQCIPWSEDPHFKYQTSAVGGNLADVLTMGDPFQDVLASVNAIEPLDQYLTTSMRNDYPASLIERYRYNGKLVALPWYVSVRTLFYRKDLLKEAGVPEPTTSWSWEQFLKYAKMLTKDRDGDGVIDQYGFGTSGKYISQYQPFVRQHGSEFIDENKGIAKVTDPKTIEALQFYIDLIQVHKVTPPGIATMDLQNIQKMFAEGKVAMFFDCEDTAISFAKEPSLAKKFGVGLMPHKEFQAAPAGSDVLVISRTSKNKKAAWKFMQFILSPNSVAQYCAVNGFTPVQKSLLNNKLLQDPIRQAFMKQMQAGTFYGYKSTKSTTFSRIIRAGVQEVIVGKKSLEEAAADMQEQLTKEMKK